MEQQQGRSLNGTTVVLSGMASSSIGLVELPYSKLPFRTNGEDLITEQIQHQNNPLLVISGASTTDDVMRGEENKGIAEQEITFKIPGGCPGIFFSVKGG